MVPLIISALLTFDSLLSLSFPGDKSPFLTNDDFTFLEEMTKDVLESSRIYPGQTVSPDFGPNNTGGILIRPGGRDCYPSFWIRDYAMSLDCGFISSEEQKHMLLLTASTQCDQTWVTSKGSMVPLGSVADHIRTDDSLPVYFPGTYSYGNQGNPDYGTVPPYCDQFFFIHMAYSYVKQSADEKLLLSEINGIKLIDRLEMACKVPPVRNGSPVVYADDIYRGVDFGFRDVIKITGDLCFPSLLKFQASKELSWLFEKMGDKTKSEKYKTVADTLKNKIPALFYNGEGMLLASTGKSCQPDVWGTALAVYLGVLEGEMLKKTCFRLTEAYRNGTLAYQGNIRHILTSDDYSELSAWEVSLAPKNTYQNGAYWGTPTGWVCYTIAKTDRKMAQKLASEYIRELRTNDYRRGDGYGAPYECFHPSGHKQNPVYLTSVTCPYAVFKLMGQQNLK